MALASQASLIVRREEGKEKVLKYRAGGGGLGRLEDTPRLRVGGRRQKNEITG